jgi:ribosomal protein S17
MRTLFLMGGLFLAFVCGRGLVASPAAPASPVPAKSGGLAGKVVETMNAASYTYVLIDTGAKKVWAAAPQFAVKVGDAVTVAEGMPMTNYHSKTLDRTFEVVYFSGSVGVNGASTSPLAAPAAGAELPKGHPPTGAAATAPATPDLSGIKRAANGQTVAEIYQAAEKRRYLI